MLGVLGGMGPLATVDFLGKLVQKTGGITDQRHIPTVVWSVPQIPDRSDYIVKTTESLKAENPFPELCRGVIALKSMGASVIVMPCNTAHFWSEQLTKNTGIKILHIADAVIEQLRSRLKLTDKKVVGLLATTGTLQSKIYQNKLNKSGWKTIEPDETDQVNIMQAIRAVKAGDREAAKAIFLEQIEKLKNQGAESIVLGCTELPAVLDDTPDLIDCNSALAHRCVTWFEKDIYSANKAMDNQETKVIEIPKLTAVANEYPPLAIQDQVIDQYYKNLGR